MKRTTLEKLPVEEVSHAEQGSAAILKQVMLRMGDIPHLTNFSQARFAPGQVAAGHAHTDMHEVFFVERGEGTITIDHKPYPLTPGTCIAVSPHETHEVSNTGTEELIITYFGIAV